MREDPVMQARLAAIMEDFHRRAVAGEQPRNQREALIWPVVRKVRPKAASGRVFTPANGNRRVPSRG